MFYAAFVFFPNQLLDARAFFSIFCSSHMLRDGSQMQMQNTLACMIYHYFLYLLYEKCMQRNLGKNAYSDVRSLALTIFLERNVKVLSPALHLLIIAFLKAVARNVMLQFLSHCFKLMTWLLGFFRLSGYCAVIR